MVSQGDGPCIPIHLLWSAHHGYSNTAQLLAFDACHICELLTVSLANPHLLFIYLFIYLRICTSSTSTGAKTIGHKSPTRFKHQPNPHLKFQLNNINNLTSARSKGIYQATFRTNYFKGTKVVAIKNFEKSLEIKRFKFTLKRVNRLSLPNIIRYIVPQIYYPIKIVVPKS